MNRHTENLDLNQALSLVSPQRKEQVLRYVKESDRRLSLAVYLLLQQALREEYGISDAPGFGFGPHGKPFLKDYPHIHFNLSHCPGTALCVVSDTPVGCDVEIVPPALDEDLCRQACSEQELSAILRAPQPPLAFAQLWTKKEAFLKYAGTGLTDHLKDVLLSPEVKGVSFESKVLQGGGCVYTVCRPTRNQRDL